MRLIYYTLMMAVAVATSRELVPIQQPATNTQCCEGGQCQPPQMYYYQQPYRQPYRQPQQGPEPDGVPTDPVGSPNTPEFNPSPPQPVNPPITPPQPTPDLQAEIAKQQEQIASLQAKLQVTINMLGDVPACKYPGDAAIDAKIAVAIAGIKIPQPTPQQPPNYDAIAAEVSKRLPPINMRVTPEAPYQSVKLGSYVTLPLDKQNP